MYRFLGGLAVTGASVVRPVRIFGMGEAFENVPFEGQVATDEEPAGHNRHSHLGARGQQHDERAEGEQLLAFLLVVERKIDDGR